MRLISVNVSPPEDVMHGRRTVTTGIFKEPVAGQVMLRKTNLDGDGQADLVNHGGAHRAAYVYPATHYEHWQRELGRDDFGFGQFGENFTVDGMTEDEVNIGDIFRVGDAIVEVSQPRPPCFKLGIKMSLPTFPKLFLASGRVGFYLRVLQEGELGVGDTFDLIGRYPEQITVREMSHLLFFEPEDLAGAERALRIRALSPGWRDSFRERVIKARVATENDTKPEERNS